MGPFHLLANSQGKLRKRSWKVRKEETVVSGFEVVEKCRSRCGVPPRPPTEQSPSDASQTARRLSGEIALVCLGLELRIRPPRKNTTWWITSAAHTTHKNIITTVVLLLLLFLCDKKLSPVSTRSIRQHGPATPAYSILGMGVQQISL